MIIWFPEKAASKSCFQISCRSHVAIRPVCSKAWGCHHRNSTSWLAAFLVGRSMFAPWQLSSTGSFVMSFRLTALHPREASVSSRNAPSRRKATTWVVTALLDSWFVGLRFESRPERNTAGPRSRRITIRSTATDIEPAEAGAPVAIMLVVPPPAAMRYKRAVALSAVRVSPCLP